MARAVLPVGAAFSLVAGLATAGQPLPSERPLSAQVNYNADLAEYWEWSTSGYLPIDPTNDAYRLGVNYFIYALTH